MPTSRRSLRATISKVSSTWVSCSKQHKIILVVAVLVSVLSTLTRVDWTSVDYINLAADIYTAMTRVIGIFLQLTLGG
jgi:hypothetical protein